MLGTLLLALSCSANGHVQVSEENVRTSVEQLKRLDLSNDQEQIFTAEMLSLQNHALSIFNYLGDDFFGFEWNTGVFDVCGDKEPEAEIQSVALVDKTHANVLMRYVDNPCYNIPYTLHLQFEDGAWKIDDVTYENQEDDTWNTLRHRCQSYYEAVANDYRTNPADEIMSNLLSMEPSEENYADPATIYYNNPAAVHRLMEQLDNIHQLFKQNPGYTSRYGQQIDAMLQRLSQHL